MSSILFVFFYNFLENFMDKMILEQQLSFSKNIECCREVIFDLRYLDVTNYIGLAESRMISYDT